MASNGQYSYFRLNGDTGNNYANSVFGVDNSAFTYSQQSVANRGFIQTNANNVSDERENLNACINLFRYTDTDFVSGNLTSTSGNSSTANQSGLVGQFTYNGSAAITSITFFSDANWSGGTVYIYGVN